MAFETSRQRPGVADTGGAAVSDHVELQLLQIGHQPGLGEIVGDNFRPGRQRCLNPRRNCQIRFSTAFFASSPAAISTEGFEVLVQDW